MKKIAPLFLTLALAFTAGCSSIKKADKPIIKVNNAVITQAMFDKSFDSTVKNSPMSSSMKIEKSNNDLIYLIYKTQVVNNLISRELIIEAAKKYHIVVKDAELNKFADKFIASIGGEKKLEAKLKENKVDKTIFLTNIKRQITINKLIDQVLGNKKISDQEIKAFYEANKTTKFSNPDMVKAQHILIAVSEVDIKQKNPNLLQAPLDKKIKESFTTAKNKAEKILVEVKANPSKFGEIAKKYSDDKMTAKNNGDLGFFAKKDMVPEFSKVAFSLKPNEISDIIKTNYGYHIIKVNETKKASVKSFEKAKDEINQSLTMEMRTKSLNKILDGIRKKSKIVYINPDFNPDKPLKQLPFTGKGRHILPNH